MIYGISSSKIPAFSMDFHDWLVVEPPTPLKNHGVKFVSWAYYFQSMEKNMFQTTNQMMLTTENGDFTIEQGDEAHETVTMINT